MKVAFVPVWKANPYHDELMNLYLLGWSVPDTLSRRVMPTMERMTEVYPRLDRSTLWKQTIGQHGFVASMHTPSAANAPRTYVCRQENQAVLYEGSLVDPSGRFRANDAAALARNWASLGDVLEGHFMVARATTNPPCLEVLTDFLGLEQVYFLHRGPTWLLSNSVRLLSQLGEIAEFDALGVSLFLSIGWVGSDRTLRRGITVMPGGQHWTWRAEAESPAQKSYYPVSRLAQQKRKTIAATAGRLADDLVTICRQLGRDYGRLRCPLTGGRDSRLLAALLIHGDVAADYYTGDPGSRDVHIGTRIASMFGLPHSCSVETEGTVVEKWDAASNRLVAQHDGLVSLMSIANLLYDPETVPRLDLTLTGIGGEIARGYFSEANLFLAPTGEERMQRWIVRKFAREHGGLVRRSATALTIGYLQQFVQSQLALGFRPVDIPDVFYTFERVRRWAGSQSRKSRTFWGNFAPLGTRPFVEAAFALSALRRWTEPLHFEVVRKLNPALHVLPFADKQWPSQRPLVHLIRKAAEPRIRRVSTAMQRRLPKPRPVGRRETALGFDKGAWLEAKRQWLRELCLDQNDSALWELIDRKVFERVTSDQFDVSERRSRMMCLYVIATLFRYALT